MWKGHGTGYPALGRSQVVLGCPQRTPRAPLSKPSGLADCSLSMFLALPIAAPLLHVFSLAGAGGGGSPEFPFVEWRGQESREEGTKSEGAGADQQGGPPLAQLPGPGPEEGAACPSSFPPPAPQGSLATKAASWAPAKLNSCQGERKKHFRAERPLWAPTQA